MDYTNYGNSRWQIVYGKYEGIEKIAVDRLFSLVQAYVPYILTTRRSDTPSTTTLYKYHRILIGTLESNAEIRRLADISFFEPMTATEGFSIKTGLDPFDPVCNITVIQGADHAGLLYAVSDYKRYAIRSQETYHGYHYNLKYSPFIDPPLPFVRRSSPKIEHRGLWSWGHVIYDYEQYINNMCDSKLNTLVLWNDEVPINATEIIEYAHERAVKVIWGFSWSWGEDVNPNDPSEITKWTDAVLHTYESEYLPLGGDGIYFQAFTETKETTIDGQSISDLVIQWVNSISQMIYAKYPDLWIQFGLHATSIQNEYHKFSALDSKMSIVWEDAGSFPYAYDPAQIKGDAETLLYTQNLLALRGREERFGAVFKGFTVLNWDKFEHQKGKYILGKSDNSFINKRSKEKDFYWRYAAPYWIIQAPFLQKILQAVASAPVQDRLITALVEDGMWESSIHLSTALLSELLWDPDQDISMILVALMHDPDVKI